MFLYVEYVFIFVNMVIPYFNVKKQPNVLFLFGFLILKAYQRFGVI